MRNKIIALGAIMALAGPVQAATINGTFSAALSEVTSSTFGIGLGTTFTNVSGQVTSANGEFSGISSGTLVSLSPVTATNGTSISFTSSFGNFIGTIKNSEFAAAAPNARVGLNALGTFTPIGSLSGFTAGLADLTLGFTQTGDLIVGEAQPSISGSFTFSSPSMIAGVPEPASWAMLIAGFGLTGASMRRRRIVSVTA